MPNKRRSTEETKELDAIVERLRDFLRLNYISYAEAAKRIGVRDYSLSSWLTGKTRPAEPERITAFLDSLPTEKSGIAPTGYECREYKNWRDIPKPQRCPFSKQENDD
jgi:transcriptional regulator with XRE-family HTH domain